MSDGENPFDKFPRLYDWEHDAFREDVAAYLALTRRFGGPVLELGCGTGRILQALLPIGFHCTGVDTSGPMLRRAHERLAGHAGQVELVQDDMRTLRLAARFRTILLPLDNLALLLTTDDQASALASARNCAAHDARLVVDVSNGNLRGGYPVEEVIHQLAGPDGSAGGFITKWVIRRAQPAEQLDALTFLYDEVEPRTGLVHRTSIDLRLRWFCRFELQLLLERSGWELVELYGDYEMGPYQSTSDRLLAVARPAGR